MFKYEIGGVLQNGATIHKFHRVRENFYIVLAHWYKCGGKGEWITWYGDKDGYCEVGVYGTYDELDRILEYYEQRVSRNPQEVA